MYKIKILFMALLPPWGTVPGYLHPAYGAPKVNHRMRFRRFTTGFK